MEYDLIILCILLEIQSILRQPVKQHQSNDECEEETLGLEIFYTKSASASLACDLILVD